MNITRSNCCGAEVKLYSGDEGTNHYICGVCGKACGLAGERVEDYFAKDGEIG